MEGKGPLLWYFQAPDFTLLDLGPPGRGTVEKVRNHGRQRRTAGKTAQYNQRPGVCLLHDDGVERRVGWDQSYDLHRR